MSFRNLIYQFNISSKLALFAFVPTLTILWFAYDNISAKNAAQISNHIINDLIVESMSMVDIINELEIERGLSIAYSDSLDLTSSSIKQQRLKVDEAIYSYQQILAQKSKHHPELSSEYKFRKKQISSQVEDLSIIRKNHKKKAENIFETYSLLIESILTTIQGLQTKTTDVKITSLLNSFSILLWIQELTAQERGRLFNAFSKGTIEAGLSYKINFISNERDLLIRNFEIIADTKLKDQIQLNLLLSYAKDVNVMRNIALNRVERNVLLNRIQNFFGYGGLIHSYKNYLIRGDKRYLNNFEVVSREALLVIKELRLLAGITLNELSQIAIIESTIKEYIKHTETISELRRDGTPVSQIDQQIKINDFPAIVALSALLKGETNIKPTFWWQKSTELIESIVEIRDELREQIIQLSFTEAEKAKKELIIYALLTIITLLFVGILSLIILKRLVTDVTGISKSMKLMVNKGNYKTPLKVHGHDELSDMANSFNTLLSTINASQIQLLGQKAAMDEHSIIATTDLRGTITYVNQKFCDISGYTKNELIGENHRILNSNSQPKSYWKEMFKTVFKGNIWHDEIKNKAKDGSSYWVDTTIVPVGWDTRSNLLDSDSNSIKGFIAIRTDITERKKQQLKLIDANIKAEQASTAKAQFLATMSHEIRTPMNGVLGMAQLLEDTSLDDEQKEYLETIIASGTNLLSIINDILDFSKLDAEMAVLEKIPFDLELLCQDSMSLVSINASDKPIEFILDYHPDCPRHLIGDPSRTRQVLMNLIGNAVKFTHKGFIRCGVSCQAETGGKVRIRIEIQDTGIGLKQSALKNLFDEFTQADTSTTRSYGGTGLGLAITKKIVALMEGEIGVDSVYGKGTTFYLDYSLSKAKIPKLVNEPSLKGIKALFVDNHKENRRIFKKMLEHMGLIITTESKYFKVIPELEIAESEGNPYQIVILDHNMPLQSGLDIGLSIRKMTQFDNQKLMIFSSIGQKGDAALFARAGFNAYLNKLCQYEVLQSILSRMLEHKIGQQIITKHTIDEIKTIESNNIPCFSGLILLAEDVLPNQIIAEKFLTNLGLKVVLANDGLDALNTFKEQKFDLVFMDCRMPDMDGYEATAAIRSFEVLQKQKATPVIALTANVSNDDRKLCINAGMNDVVTKPFKQADLIQCLSRWLPGNNIAKAEKVNAPNSKSHPSLDKKIYKTLQQDMEDDFEHVVETIYESINSLFEALQSSDENTPILDLTRFAHSLKSIASNLGALQLAKLADELETELNNKNRSNVEKYVSLFIEEYKNVCQAISNL